MTDRIHEAAGDFLEVLKQEINTSDFFLMPDDISGDWFVCVIRRDHLNDDPDYDPGPPYYHKLYEIRGVMTKEEAKRYMDMFLMRQVSHIERCINDLTGYGLYRFIY